MVARSGRFACAVVASWLIHLTLGTFYSWGNAAPYIVSYMRQQGHDVTYENMSWVVSIAGFFQGIFMFIGGKLQPTLGLRGTALLGGWTLSIGVGLSFFTVKLGQLPFLLTYSAMFGMGLGLAYTAPMVCMVKWLPEMKGLASGIVVFGFGAGAFVFNFVQTAWANSSGLKPDRELPGSTNKYYDWEDPAVVHDILDHVPSMFLLLGGVFATMQLLGVMLLCEPLSEPDMDGSAQSAQLVAQEDSADIHLTASAMIRTSTFWYLALGFFFNAQAILFATSFEKTFGAATIPGGISDELLTVISAVASLFNGLGRLCWGALGDKFTFRPAMVALCLMQSALLASLAYCGSAPLYFVWICGIFFCVGGNFSLFPGATATHFGAKHLGSNYGLVFFGPALSMLWGSALTQTLTQHVKSHATLAFIITGFVLCGCMMATLVNAPRSGLKVASAGVLSLQANPAEQAA